MKTSPRPKKKLQVLSFKKNHSIFIDYLLTYLIKRYTPKNKKNLPQPTGALQKPRAKSATRYPEHNSLRWPGKLLEFKPGEVFVSPWVLVVDKVTKQPHFLQASKTSRKKNFWSILLMTVYSFVVSDSS